MVTSPPEPLELLRETGLRATAQRLTILRAIVSADGHPTAEEVWESAREDQQTLSLSTVYDTLSRFVEVDLIDEVHGGEGATRYEFSDHPHVNVVCSSCGDVRDVDVDVDTVATLIEAADTKHGFEVPTQPVELEGLCATCQAD